MKHPLPLLLFLLAVSISGCSHKDEAITQLSMLSGGKTFAVPTGTAADQFVLKKFPDAKIEYYNSALDCALAVKEGKAEGGAYDKPILKNIAAKNDGLMVLDELLADDRYGFAVQIQNKEVKAAIDQTLADIKADGTYNDMMKRWFPSKGSPEPMPAIELNGNNGVLRFGTAAVTEPMSFHDASNKVVGFDVEFACYVARKLNKKIEIIDMEFGAMLPALIAGKVDMIGAGLSITEERAKKVLFSESYYPSGIALIVRTPAVPVATTAPAKLRSLNDLKDKKIGVLLGSIHDTYANQQFPNAQILQYQNTADLLIAMNSDKVDAIYYDQASVPDIFSKNPDLGMLAKDIFYVPIGAGFNQDNDQLREQFNAFLKEIKANGVYDDIVDRWINRNITQMPEIKGSTNNGTLNVGVVNDLGLPFTIVQNGQMVGFDIEIAARFAAYLGKEFVPVPLQFGSLIASISTKKIDVITASMMINEERKKQIDFSDPYYECGVSIITKKDNLAPAPAGQLTSVDQLAEKKIGVFTGTVHDAFIAGKYPKAEILRYTSSADMMLSLQTGKVDAAMLDLMTARLILKRNPELGILSDNVLSMDLGVGFNKDNPKLRDEFNAFLNKVKEDGTYDQAKKRWMDDDAENAVMPTFKTDSSGKKLVAGVSVDDLPWVAFMNNDYAGFDIEMIRTFAERNHYQLEIITMDFQSLIAALAAGKVDLITDGIAITPERQKQIDFSAPYAQFRTAVVVAAKNLAGHTQDQVPVVKKPFLKRVSESFHNNIILEKRYLLIINGLLITILISIFAAILGTILGGGVCFMKMSKNKFLSGFAEVYISLLRGTPVLVLLMIIYYIVFASVNINPVIVAILAFALNFAAYVSEMFRTAIEGIDKGQREAGIAAGFTKVQVFIQIITPQALRHLLPVYKGEFISLVKMTSIVGYIAVQDLTKASDIIRSRTFDAFFPLIMAAVLYLLIAWLLTRALSAVEISVDPKRKRTAKKMEAI